MVATKEQDHYKILGVKKGCPDSEIKKCYYKLAKKWHPDKNSSPLAEDKFKEINRAYEILSDEKKRTTYDLTYTDRSADILKRTSTSFSAKSRSTYVPKSANFTFFTNTSSTDYTSSYDAKWHEFTKANNFYDPTRATENPFPNAHPKYKPDLPPKYKPDPTPPPPPPKYTPSFSTKFNRESFYRGFKKYFDADYYSTDTDDDSDSVIIEDFYNELSNKAKKARGDSARKRTSSAPKWKKNWEEMNKNKNSFAGPNTENSTKAPPEEPPKKNFSKNGENLFNGFKFNSKSSPFELLETFAMYKLFSEMSHRLFKDVDDDEMLINLAKIISSFNLPPKNKMNTSPMNSFRKQNSEANTEEPPPATRPSPMPGSPKTEEKNNSDFVFSETIRRKREEERYRSERSRSNTTPSPTAKTNAEKNVNSWEFEWMGGKKETKSSENSSPAHASSSGSSNQQSSDSDSFDEIKYNSNSENNDSFKTNYTKYFECNHCFKRLTGKDELLSHQSICKYLLTNRHKNKYFSSDLADFYPTTKAATTTTTTTTSTTECSKCKVSMNTYDYLMHQCDPSKCPTKSENSTNINDGAEPRTNLQSANSNLSSSSSFKYAYRPKPSIDTKINTSRRPFETKPASAGISRTTTYIPTSTVSPRAPSQPPHSDFVFSKIRTPLSTSKKQYPDVVSSLSAAKSFYTPSVTPKRSLHDTENNKPKTNLLSTYGSSTNPIKKTSLFNGAATASTYGGLDSSSYTTSTYRPVMPQQSFSSASYSKPYSSFTSSSYSKPSSSKLISNASFSGTGSNKYGYPFNAYTGLKREKLRTGF